MVADEASAIEEHKIADRVNLVILEFMLVSDEAVDTIPNDR